MDSSGRGIVLEVMGCLVVNCIIVIWNCLFFGYLFWFYWVGVVCC